MLNFLNKEIILVVSSFGLRSKLSSENALLYFMEQVYDRLNNGKCCASLVIDVMKAFDTVDHVISLDRLSNAGIRGVAHSWFLYSCPCYHLIVFTLYGTQGRFSMPSY